MAKRNKINTSLPPVYGSDLTTRHTGRACRVCGSPMYGIYRNGMLEVKGCPNEDKKSHWGKTS